MDTYSMMVEGLVQRYIYVQAKNKAEAKKLAKKEFCSLVGSTPDSITQCIDLRHYLNN